MPTRKHFSASQKAQIALEILKEEKTVNQLASEYGVHPNVLYRWKKQALENPPKLFEDEKAEAVRKLLASPLTIADVVFAVVRPTAEQRNITAEQFGELLAGQNMADAADSLLEALEVFFSGQDANMGASFQKFLDGYRRGRSTVWNRARQEVELLDPEKVANEAFEKALQKRRAALTSGFASGD